MFVWLEIETLVISKGSTKRGGKHVEVCGGRSLWAAGLHGTDVWVWCVSAVVVEGACVRDFRGMGECMVGRVG
jgi:hypothetical protein